MTVWKVMLICVAIMVGRPALASPEAMTPQEARHLISRTGFGASPHEIAAFTGLSYTEGVARIMDGLRTEPVTQMPAWVEGWYYPSDQIWTLGQTQSELYFTSRWIEIQQLGGWWMSEMVATPSPMTERLVLFWSDHFANSFDAHENSQWMGRQNAFLRANAAGNFADLAHGILRDPAMLEYLDNTSNFPDAPNENLGREFLELFTLGEGRGYTQDDVRGAAAALTGLTVEDDGNPVFIYDASQHDDGPKTLFGRTGNFDADDLVTLTLSHPDFGPYIVEKLWLAFISDQPDAQEIARLTALWIEADLEMRPLLKALFLSDAFWDEGNRGRLIKGPVELLVGTTRTLGFTLPDARDYAWIIEDLGQIPFLPPNVGGWPEGVEWINDATASGRATALTYLLYDVSERGADAPVVGGMGQDGMMMALPSAVAPVTDTAPGDLRVGQVFVTYVEDRDAGGIGGSITLFDVSFGGETWRSMTMWLDHNPRDNWAGLYAFTGDCGGCWSSLPMGDDDGWVSFEPWVGMLDEMQIKDADVALMRAIGSRLPALLETTRRQQVFLDEAASEYLVPVVFEQFHAASLAFARASEEALGGHDGGLILAPSRVNVLGLSGFSDGDVDLYADALAEASVVPMQPPQTYADARAWINALPGTGLESVRAAEAILAVPRRSDGQRDEMIAGDPEALLRSLILSPAYQVN